MFAITGNAATAGGYWEVANEPDIGEDGGCPYRFKPDNYVRYYQHTAAAILRADPKARVGGPALASSRSPILPALLGFCSTNSAPLHFVSWHIYSSEPKDVRGTIDYVKDLLTHYPSLKVETFLDEWNMDLMNPPLDPRYQPCYVAEVIWQMKDAGLDYSCYYHLRDWQVDFNKFAPFFSPHGAAFMTRWWNRMPQFDGLFDYQNQVRPAYFVFKLLSRLAGEQLRLTSTHPAVHGFATHDEQLRMHNLMLWNFSSSPVPLELSFKDLPGEVRIRHIVLDATTASSDENARLRPEPFTNLKNGDQHFVPHPRSLRRSLLVLGVRGKQSGCCSAGHSSRGNAADQRGSAVESLTPDQSGGILAGTGRSRLGVEGIGSSAIDKLEM